MRFLLNPAFLLVALSAHADRITLVNGNTVEGKAEPRGEIVHVALRRGWVDLPRSAVARIEAGEVPWEAYAGKASGLAPTDARGHAALAAWCVQNALPDEALEQYRLALKADGAHAEARKAVEEAAAREKAAQEAREARQALRRPPRFFLEGEEGEERPREFLFRDEGARTRRAPRASAGNAPLWEGSVVPWIRIPSSAPSACATGVCPAQGLGLVWSGAFDGGRGRIAIRLGGCP